MNCLQHSWLPNRIFADSREAQHYAELAAQGHEARQQRWEGRGTVRSARVGTYFALTQGPWEGTGSDMPNSFVWTMLHHAGINNLPEAVQQAAHEQLGDVGDDVDLEDAASPALWQQASAVGYAQHFNAVARELPWRAALDDDHGLRLNPRPTVPGIQTAIVVGPEGETTAGASGPLHTDGMGRLKVKFHWMHDGVSCWLRSAQRRIQL